jgi:hypothetical protein
MGNSYMFIAESRCSLAGLEFFVTIELEDTRQNDVLRKYY